MFPYVGEYERVVRAQVAINARSKTDRRNVRARTRYHHNLLVSSIIFRRRLRECTISDHNYPTLPNARSE